MRKLVLASSNPGKIREFRQLLAPLGMEVVPQADFGVPDVQDQRNNERLVALLRPQSDRRAHYYCVVVLARHADDPEPLIAEGRWHGEVLEHPRGAGGFGYDPHFFVPALGRTAAELAPEEKHAVSHRGHASRRLIALLREEG